MNSRLVHDDQYSTECPNPAWYHSNNKTLDRSKIYRTT